MAHLAVIPLQCKGELRTRAMRRQRDRNEENDMLSKHAPVIDESPMPMPTISLPKRSAVNDSATPMSTDPSVKKTEEIKITGLRPNA